MPVAFAVLAPVAAAGALLLVSRGADVPRSWGMVVVLLALLSVSAVVAKSTGEDQEDRVEEVVPHAAIETHEEAADVFTIGSFILLAVAAVGLVRGQVGRWARLTATLGTLALLWAGYAVGHSGGRLVYQHGGRGGVPRFHAVRRCSTHWRVSARSLSHSAAQASAHT
jgi:hypothetical protein